ncbi:MAG: PKD domain-containing protein [Proteobacteria bacterium]|nr:PKD domain-containing protein [Pseudomonadota bacterium]
MKFFIRYGLCLVFFVAPVVFSYSQDRTFTIYYSECKNCNTSTQSYEDQEPFITHDISSDFGRRRGISISNWHRGVDYNNDHDYVGDHLFSVFDGTIAKIIVTPGSQYKIIVIDGFRDLGYGHIFEKGQIPSAGMKYGDMVIKKMEPPNQNLYAIINLTDDYAIGEEDGATVEYTDNGTLKTYTVTNQISYNNPIAVIGRSGDNSPPYFDYHLHLYHFKDINIVTQKQLGYKEIDNDKDPLEIINHASTDYTVTIEGKTLRIDNQQFINSSNVVIFPGNESISLKTRYAMDGAVAGNRYSDVVMNIDGVELFIKKPTDAVEGFNQWGDPTSNYKLLKGPWFESKINHGARLNHERYYSIGNPQNNQSYDLSGDNRVGSTKKTGILPWAYSDGNDENGNPFGQPYDEFFYSDFKTRIHKNDSFGQSSCTYANSTDEDEARYPDGKYHIYAKVTTVEENVFPSDVSTPTEIIIDNFRPFIKKVEISKYPGGEPVYSRAWSWNGNTYLIEPPPFNLDIKTNNNLYVKVTASEAMEAVSMILNGHEIQYTGQNDAKTEWHFSITANQLNTGENTLEINGTDLAANAIINNPPYIPIRQQNGVWLPDPAPFTGADMNHSIFVSEPNEVDFDATQVGWPDRTIFFEDKSSTTVGDSYWEFGDGFTGDGKSILHTYWNAGTYPVTHTINNNDEITKNVLVRNLEIPNADFIYTIDPPPPERTGDVTVHFFDQSEGIIKTWSWEFGNGVPSSNEPNPVVELEMFTDYDISLTTTNYAGTSESQKHFYYDPAETPQVLIIPWQNLSYYYNIDVSVSHLVEPFTYEIDFGDGTSQTITSSLNWETFNHQYFNWGDYLITAQIGRAHV